MTTPRRKPRYRFGEFVISPARRQLLRGGREVPLIPRYLDLLLLLVERRDEAVHRRDILETVWSDVVVSDSALSQAIRILRRTLGDEPRRPVFIRTVQRHGYRFVHENVIEEPDNGSLPEPTPGTSAGLPERPERLTRPTRPAEPVEPGEPVDPGVVAGSVGWGR